MMKQKSTSAARIQENSRQRREQEKREVRQTILTTAGEMFLESGYEGFSLRQIAERIGYSPGTIYLYFKDKDDVLFTVCKEGFIAFAQVLENAKATTDDPLEQIRVMGREYVRFGLENPAYYQLMFMQRPEFMIRQETETGEPPVDAFMILQRTVEEAMAAGSLQPGDAQVTSDVLWSALHGVVALGICMPIFDAERVEKTAAFTLTMLEQYLAADS
ncbi:MAG: TetR/AcrR family transcriptional regulator [Anaerolineae bacterium]